MTDRIRYFEQASEWATELQVKEAKRLRAVWTVTGVAISVALLEALALALLAPLKTVQPITLLVDRQTGYVQALDPLNPPKIAADTALTQAYLAQYVAAREGYDRATIKQTYRRAALWSTGSARTQYLALMSPANNDGPLSAIASGGALTVHIKSVSRLSDSAALVRFDTQRGSASGQLESARPWISFIRFRYSTAPMAFEDRLANPLGFQVLTYRRDAEAPPPAPQQATPIAYSMPSAKPSPSRAGADRRAIPYAALMAYRGIDATHLPLGSPLSPIPVRSVPGRDTLR